MMSFVPSSLSRSAVQLADAHENDRQLRAQTRKRGHTTPLAVVHVKRPKAGTTLAEQQRLYRLLPEVDSYELPSNTVQINELRPFKRLKTRTSQDQVLVQLVAQ